MSITPTYDVFADPVGGGLVSPASVDYYVGSSSPAMGLCLVGARRFTTASHNYTASLRPKSTNAAPNPAAIFTNRPCVLYYRQPDRVAVVTYDWTLTDLNIPIGPYRFQIKATQIPSGKVEFFQEVEFNVVAGA